MSYASRLQAYKTSAVTTATPGHLVVMLYDGAIKFLNVALKGFESEDPLELNLTVHTNLSKAQAVFRELRFALDTEKGGELATNLAQLYDYFDRRLHAANMKKSREMVEEVHRHATGLRDAWRESVAKSTAQQATTPASTAEAASPSLSLLG